MRVFEKTILTDGDMSSNIVTIPQKIIQMHICSIQANWTGTPTGSLGLNRTNDDPQLVQLENVVWSFYTGSTTMVEGPGNFLWNILSCGFNSVQVIYTAIAGSGSLTVTVSGKGV